MINLLHIRRAAAGDIPAIMELARQSSSAAHWLLADYERIFATTDPAGPSYVALVIEPSKRLERTQMRDLLGFLVARRVGPEWELQNIVVSESVRRQGIGASLLEDLVSLARNEGGAAIFLEVRESNHAARDLYLKAGFREVGRRRAYYTSPAEDAILWRLDLARPHRV